MTPSERASSVAEGFPQRAFLTKDARLIVASEGNFRLKGKGVKGPFHLIVPLNNLASCEEKVTFVNLADYSPVPGMPTEQELEAVEIPVSPENVLLSSTEAEGVIQRLQEHRRAHGEREDPSTPMVFRAQMFEPAPGGSAGFVFYSGDLFPPAPRILVGMSSELRTPGEKFTSVTSKLVTIPFDIATIPVQIPFYVYLFFLSSAP